MSAPIINVSWIGTYDALLGTTPTAQGWTKSGIFTSSDTPSAGLLRMTSAGSAYWTKGSLSSCPSTGIVLIHARLKLETTQVYGWDIYASNGGVGTYSDIWPVFTGTYAPFGDHTRTFYDPQMGTLGFKDQIPQNTLIDLVLKVKNVAGASTPRCGEIWWRLAGSHDRDDAAGYVKVGLLFLYGNGPLSSSSYSFGDRYFGLGCDVSVECVRYSVTSGTDILSTSGQILFNESITDLPLVSIDVTPSHIGQGQTSELAWSTTGQIGVIVNGSAAASGGNQTAVTWDAPTNAAFSMSINDSTIAPGEISTLSWSSTGSIDVLLNGASVAVSGSATAASGVNGPAASVVMTVDDASLAATEVATLSYAVSGNVNVLLNGGAISGVGNSVVATAEAAPTGTTPPNQPTLVNIISEPSRPTYIGVL